MSKNLFQKLFPEAETMTPFLNGLGVAVTGAEIVLNREWLYDNFDEPVGERNFVISVNYLESIFPLLFPKEESIIEFLDSYVPEEDGEKIYQKAKSDGQVLEEGVDL